MRSTRAQHLGGSRRGGVEGDTHTIMAAEGLKSLPQLRRQWTRTSCTDAVCAAGDESDLAREPHNDLLTAPGGVGVWSYLSALGGRLQDGGDTSPRGRDCIIDPSHSGWTRAGSVQQHRSGAEALTVDGVFPDLVADNTLRGMQQLGGLGAIATGAFQGILDEVSFESFDGVYERHMWHRA